MTAQVPGGRRPYDRTRRLAAAMQTREAILAAARQLLRKRSPEELSLAEVAAQAGISERTVYRHFARPAELVQAVAQDFMARILPPGPVAEELPQLPEQLGGLQRALSKEPSLYPLFFALPARSGVELPQRVQRWAQDVLEALPPADRPALSGLVELLVSPYAWDVLHSHWGVPPERITRACIAALQAVLDGVKRHPEWLDPAAPPPPRFRNKKETTR